jgi:hypothetical protein
MKDIPNNEKNKNDSNNSINHYSDSSSEWSSAEYALEYLEIAEKIPHKDEGEKVLLEYIPADAERILDLGTGDGRLIKLIKSKKQQQLSASSSTSLSSFTPEITVCIVYLDNQIIKRLVNKVNLHLEDRDMSYYSI